MANIVNKTKPVRNLVVFTIFFLTAFIFVPVGRAADDIILDGAFADWVGQSGITDPVGDASRPFDDLTGFYFATNPDDSTAYFMAERVSSNSPLNLVLLIDTNDDGVYDDPGDRYITVSYNPQGNSSSVEVMVYNGTGGFVSLVTGGSDWGESGREGGSRVEWGVSFADLGLSAGQAIRMVLESHQGSATADTTEEVQWSPANALGWALIAILVAGGATWLTRQRRQTDKPQ
jgi:hypothetical protein